MQFCLIYPNKSPYCNASVAASVAEAAEEAGFYAFLVWDHYTLPSGPETLDAWGLLAYVAGRTSTIRLGTCVTPIPLRPPALLAKQVATVDVLSGGRTILGVGAGWHQPEFEGYSQWDPVPVRVSRVAEGLKLIIRLWQEKRVDFAGDYYRAKGALLEPKPVQKPYPPLWFGAFGKRMLRLAARYGEAWIPTQVSPREYGRELERIQEQRRRVGTSGRLKGALQLMNPYHEPRDYLRSIEDYAAAGCELYGVVWSYPPEEMVERIRWFAREVMIRSPQ